MSKTYFGAIKEVFGDQVQVIDRFHVVQQAMDALDAVLSAVKKHLDKDEAKELKKLHALAEVLGSAQHTYESDPDFLPILGLRRQRAFRV